MSHPKSAPPSGHDPNDERGDGGAGGLSGAAPGADEEATPEGEDSVNEPEPEPGEPAEGDDA